MRPIETVLARLPHYKPSGKGFTACCPAHDDRNPSLSITEGRDGGVRLKCFAGCSGNAIVAALGLHVGDLFPTGAELPDSVSTRQPPKAYPTAEEATAAYGRGVPSQEWAYHDTDGNEVGRTLRWETANGKEIRPIGKFPDGWRLSTMPALRPLFNLPALLANPESPVYVAEGEKCVDALTLLRLLATTSAGGSGAAQQTDWKPLAGRRVIVLPDNDEAGCKFAETVGGLLRAINAEVQIAYLDGRPENGGDVADIVEGCSGEAERDAIRHGLLAMAATHNHPESGPPPVPTPTAYDPFPTTALPEPISTLVIEAARAIGCDEAAVALPCLTAIGVAGANWRFIIKENCWIVPPTMWSAIALPSGSLKSPAIDITLDYFRQRQEQLTREHEEAVDKRKANRPKTIWTDNATTEGLDEAFKRNPRAILYGCDELSGWLGTFGLYKHGRSKSDEGWYCQRYNGRTSNIVRCQTGQRNGCASGLLGVTGCITIDTLRSLLTPSVQDAGLMARLVICMPPVRKRRWTDLTISAASRQRYESLLDRLFEDDEPRVARLSPEAKDLWVAFLGSHSDESEQLESSNLRAAFSKLEELPARLALILHVAESGGCEVSGDVMARAITVAEWAKNETRRAYAILRPGQPDSALHSGHRRLLALMARKGPIRVRQVQAACHAYRGKSAPETRADLDSLVASGHARQMPDGAYECVRTSNPDPVAAPPTPAPTPPSADVADVLMREGPWKKL